MDIILTPNGEPAVHLSWLPEKLKYGGAGKFMTYGIISLGDVKVPRGNSLDNISWNAIFPGATRITEPYVKSEFWEDPSELVDKFRDWRDNGTKVNVTITETSINMDCYVEKFEGKYTGGHGDFEYDVTFVEAQEITITAIQVPAGETGSKKKKKNSKKKRKTSKKKKKATSKSKPKTQTYTVKSGDSLWKIAQSKLGNGARYSDIYDKNKSKLGSTTDELKPGTVLTLPAS